MTEEKLISGIFSDETEDYRSPAEPETGDTVTIKLRVPKDSALRVTALVGEPPAAVLAERCASDGRFDLYQTSLVCMTGEVSYRFLAETAQGTFLCDRRGTVRMDGAELPPPDFAFRFMPGFHVPEWAKGAVQYQIFPDRFCNGNPDNDVTDGEYYYNGSHVRHVSDWNALPEPKDTNRFYGGDLQGIEAKLDYLRSLGIEVLYLNPIFVSPSNHKYDTQDYEHVDPHLSVIAEDMDHTMEDWEKHNGYAPKYIKRTAAAVNLEASDAYFAFFCEQVHRRGMRIILDGVFNHCGSFSKWMDRGGIYLNKPGYLPGAYQSTDSPYREYFRFRKTEEETEEYESWWEYATLPKLNYEGSEKLCEQILSLTEKWARPPYAIDGWRLDVAADLGHSPAFNHRFWQTFRQRLKAVNPELLIVAEHYGDPSDWLRGREWDTVMNYDAFMEPVSFFLTGMEKHSEAYMPELHRDGAVFLKTMLERSAVFPRPSLLCAMNELSNHDHSRFLTRTNSRQGRLESHGPAAADSGVNKALFRLGVVIQMTWPGAPTVYYGDEAGQTGWTDPDSRRTYPWGREDRELIEFHREIIRLRSSLPVLKSGSVKPLLGERDTAAYARFSARDCVITAVNCGEEPKELLLCAADVGAEEGDRFRFRLLTGENGFETDPEARGPITVSGGMIRFTLPACAGAILSKTEKGADHDGI